jgi:MFS family permease
MARIRRSLAEYDALAVTAAIWFLAKFLRYAFPPLFGTLQSAYGVSVAGVGTLYAGMMLAYALMQFPSGVLADRLGAVRVIAGGGLVAAGAALLLAGTSAFPALLLGMLGVGVGTGAHKTVAVGLMSRVYPRRTGRALGAMDTLGALGGVAAPAAVVAAGAAWRTVFLAAGVAGVALVAWFVGRVPRNGGEAGSGDEVSYAGLLADRRVAAFVGVTVLFSFAYNGVVAFLPLYLVDAGLTEATASLLYSLLFAVSLVQTVSGELSDRVGPLAVVGGTLALATAGLAATLVLGGGLALGAAVVVFGLGSHAFRPVRDAYLVSVLPEQAAGGTLGAVRTLLMGAGALSPAVVGYAADVAGFVAAFALLAASMVGALALLAGQALSPDAGAT